MYKVLVALLAAPALGLPTCSEYCTSIMQVCNGTNAQFSIPGYDSATALAFCNVLCGVYPAGLDSDTSGDSLGCRAYHLAVAKNFSDMGDAANVAFHCPHAGFYGGGACGMPVDFQCDFMAANCQYQGTHAACVTDYGMYSAFVSDRFNASFTRSLLKVTGATLQCRTANAFNVLQPGATPAAIATACQEAQPVSSACSVNCADFCMLEGDVCGFGTGGNNQYADMKACSDACMGWQKIAPNTTQQSTQLTSGDSADCRWYHLGVASGSDTLAATHCPHTASYPTVACTSSCDNYCATIQAACVGPNMQFADNTACLAACANYTSLASGYARPVTTGNNLQCRSYHAFVAATNYQLAMVHCPHAGELSTAGTCGDNNSGSSGGSGDNSASSFKVGAATAFLVLVGAVSAMFSF